MSSDILLHLMRQWLVYLEVMGGAMDIAVVILTKDEKLHIGRCLERIAALLPRQVFVVDCFSTDGTQRIVEEGQNDKIGQTHFIISVVEH